MPIDVWHLEELFILFSSNSWGRTSAKLYCFTSESWRMEKRKSKRSRSSCLLLSLPFTVKHTKFHWMHQLLLFSCVRESIVMLLHYRYWNTRNIHACIFVLISLFLRSARKSSFCAGSVLLHAFWHISSLLITNTTRLLLLVEACNHKTTDRNVVRLVKGC